MTESQEEKDQRLRDINRRIIDITAARAKIIEQFQGAPPSDVSVDVLRMDTELGELRRERQRLQEPGALLIWDRVNDMWAITLDLDKAIRARWKNDDRDRLVWRGVYLGWMTGLTIAIIVIGLTVF